jgi:Na+/H+ antiporter NhaC
VLIPPLVAIVLAVLTRQVVPALFIATLVASYMLIPCNGAAKPAGFEGSGYVLRGLRVGVEQFMLGAIYDTAHIQIMAFTLLIGGMVGVIGANGGTRSVVDLVGRWATTSRRGQLVGWVSGHAIFFDDYANTMILGPTLRPLYDRLRISRAKLAYIVDSTAAPVASLVPIGTWIGAEIGYIDDGLNAVKSSAGHLPEAIANVSAYNTFLASIGYRFYALFALALVLFIALTRRDFGPMRKAEREASQRGIYADTGEPISDVRGSWWYAVLPVLAMVGVTIGILVVPGWQSLGDQAQFSFDTLRQILEKADPYVSILYGALAGLILSVIISLVTRAIALKATIDATLDGMSRMFPALVILILAWSLSQATQALELGNIISHNLDQANFSPQFVPIVVFGAACLVSFATGTSWGTMGILCPVAVEVAARLCTNLPQAEALPLFYSSVGAVLAGAIFGDHCSPISDTTVLSSLASSCSLEEHVWTQIPYALTAAVVSVAIGHTLCNILHQPWWLALTAGLVVLFLIVLFVGKKTPDPAPPAMT